MTSYIVVAGVIIVVIVGMALLIGLLGKLYRKVGPNRALIVYGKGGTKVIVGGGIFVNPFLQTSEEFNLEIMSFDVAPSFSLYTNQGIPLMVEAITQLKVDNEPDKIKRAANQFLSLSESDREQMIRQVMEGHLRGIVGQLTVEQLVKDPELVSARMRETVAADLDKLGLEVVSFTIKDVNDKSNYITNMSRPEIARNKQTAEIAEAEAERNVAMKQSETQREAASARAKADQDRVLAQTLSQAAQDEASRNLEIKQATYKATIAAEKAQADQAYDIQSAITKQRQVEETTKVTIVQKQQEIKIQQAEGERRAAELLATVQKSAEAEAVRVRIEAEAEAVRVRIAAEAEQQRTILQAQGVAQAARLQAEGEAAATVARGDAEAQSIKARGLAEAEALRARGEAEAEALRRRVDALNEQNKSALLNTALSSLPEMARALSEAYSKIGSVTYVASGNGEGVTARMAQEIVGMVPMLGAILESTTGLSVRGMLNWSGKHGAEQSAAVPGVSSSPDLPIDHLVPVQTVLTREGEIVQPVPGGSNGQAKLDGQVESAT